jgi:hypothetical protein
MEIRRPVDSRRLSIADVVSQRRAASSRPGVPNEIHLCYRLERAVPLDQASLVRVPMDAIAPVDRCNVLLPSVSGYLTLSVARWKSVELAAAAVDAQHNPNTHALLVLGLQMEDSGENPKGLRGACVNDVVLGVIGVVGLVVFFWVLLRASGRGSQECPRCHHRFSPAEPRCPRCGWRDTTPRMSFPPGDVGGGGGGGIG